jgi:co-chaperonin GroES (HSP10)
LTIYLHGEVVENKKRINVLNDFVAVMIPKTDSGLVIEDNVANLNNEGIVVGVSPGAEEQFSSLLGWKVIFRNGRHIPMSPLEGDYAGFTVLIMPKTDLVVRLGEQLLEIL